MHLPHLPLPYEGRDGLRAVRGGPADEAHGAQHLQAHRVGAGEAEGHGAVLLGVGVDALLKEVYNVPAIGS